MSVITKVPEPNLWETICKEFEAKRAGCANPSACQFKSSSCPPLEETSRPSTNESNYDPKRHNPVFCTGQKHVVVSDIDCLETDQDFDPAIGHPTCIGYAFIERPTRASPPPCAPLPPKKTCSPRVYLETYVFPLLIPALEAMLQQAKLERCFERKRTAFNALDFLTRYLYSGNADYPERRDMTLGEIPFVAEWWTEHPRAALPLSLVWSEDEAALKIQCFWRGYLVRRRPEISELRQWQREWREINQDARVRVRQFWADKLPVNGEDEGSPAQGGSLEQLQSAPDAQPVSDVS